MRTINKDKIVNAVGHVVVLKGGDSVEREISLISGDAVFKGLQRLGVSSTAIDVGTIIISDLEQEKPDLIIDIQDTADDLTHESLEIHDMIEHISNHLEKCKTVYQSREKKEIDEIGRHITTLDKKMHTLMNHISEFEKFTKN